MSDAPVAPATVRALNCPGCGGAIEMHAAGYTVSLVCPHCGSTLDATDPALALLNKAHRALKRPRIPLGTRGMLDGTRWAAIGYMERRSEDGGWSEYLLFNPYRGYRWLVDDGTRFSFGQLLDRAPQAKGEDAVLAGKTYRRVEPPYPAEVTFVVGEFPWRVAVGETVIVTDHATGQKSLSAEENNSERTWTLLRRLHPGVAERTFGIVTATPARASAGGRAGAGLLKPLWTIAAIAFVVLMIAAATVGPASRILFRQELEVALDAPERTVVMGPVVIDRTRAGVTVQTQATGLDNAWVDLDYALVDRATQARYEAYGLAEDYNGRDSDGPWREGDTGPRTRFAAIPRGSYDLVLDVSAHKWTGATTGSAYDGTGTSYGFGPDGMLRAEPPPPPPPVGVIVIVRRGATFAGNFWLAALLIAAWPAFALYRRMRGAT